MNGFDRVSLEASLKQGLRQMGLEVSELKQTQLLEYLALIHKWNKVHNLTAVREPADMVVLHLLDSLAVLPYVGNSGRLIDVGSGAGLPGIPLAICLTGLHVTVLDSSQKKTSFMRQVKGELGLLNLEVVCDRVEKFQPAAPYDVIISRAFSDLGQFVGLTRHLCKPSGQWLAMKGVYPTEELAQIEVQPSRVEPLNVAGLSAQRHLVFLLYESVAKTSEAS